MGAETDALTQNVVNSRSVTRAGINLVIAEQESILNTISNQVDAEDADYRQRIVEVEESKSEDANDTISNPVDTLPLDADDTIIWLSSKNYSIDRILEKEYLFYCRMVYE